MRGKFAGLRLRRHGTPTFASIRSPLRSEWRYSTETDNNTANGLDLTSVTPEAGSSVNSTESAYIVIYNSWGNWSPKFTDDKLLLSFHAVLGNTQGTLSAPNGNGNANYAWYGVETYANHQFNDWLHLTSRAEWMRSNNSWMFGKQGAATTAGLSKTHHGTGNNRWEYTLTAGFNLIDNLLFRAEYRMGWGSNIYKTTNGAPAGAQSGGPVYHAGAKMVYSFLKIKIIEGNKKPGSDEGTGFLGLNRVIIS